MLVPRESLGTLTSESVNLKAKSLRAVNIAANSLWLIGNRRLGL
jgi:hypothetical protein